MSLFAAMTDDGSVWAKSSSLFNLSSPLNDLLERDDFTLEELLEEDELIQEVKTRNARLLEFLSQDETVEKLVEYVVTAPENPDDDLRAIKYPYMSCEVICCDIASITDTLATGKEGQLAENLLAFLYQEPPLDPRLAGYFEKIMSMLMVRKPQEMTVLLNKHSDELLQSFVRHVQSFSVSELLKRLLQPYEADYMDDMMDFPGMSLGFPSSSNWYGGAHDDDEGSVGTPTPQAQKTLRWQEEPTVIDLLIGTLAPADDQGNFIDSDVHKHAADVLVDVIHCGIRAQQNAPSSPLSAAHAPESSSALLEHLETETVVDKVLDFAIPATTPEKFSASSMTAALSVLSALLSRHTNARYAPSEELPPVVERTLARLPQLCSTLKAEDHEVGMICNQRHQEVPRLGIRRLKLIGLLVLLVQSKYHKVDAALKEHNVIDLCLDLFFKFESVNMLHADVESMVIGILEGGSNDLLTGLIRDARLLPRVLEGHEQNEAVVAERKGCSFGYVGHLHRICNMILSLVEEAQGEANEEEVSLNDMAHVDNVLDMLREDKAAWKKWEELADNVLMPIYERERVPLGGVSVGPGSDDPYAVMGFNQNDELLNAQFAEMLGASAYGPDDRDFDTDFDLPPGLTDTPMLPEIMDDSSSSEEEDEDVERRMLGVSGVMSPIGARAEDDTINMLDDDGGEKWAKLEASTSWTPFETGVHAPEDAPGAPTLEGDKPETTTTDELSTAEAKDAAVDKVEEVVKEEPKEEAVEAADVNSSSISADAEAKDKEA